MNKPEVFKINRVNKAMVSLAERVASAKNIAGSIPQVKTVVLNLKDKDKQQSNIPDDSTPNPPKQQGNDLQLGAVFPNTFIHYNNDRNYEFILIVEKGEIGECFIIDNDGKNQCECGWRLQPKVYDELSEETQAKVYAIREASKLVDDKKLKFFSVKIPSSVEYNSCYYFVAQSKYPEQKDDRLMLFVSPVDLSKASGE